MKLAAIALALLPGITSAATWTSQGFPSFTAEGTGKFASHAELTKGTRSLTLNFDQQCWQPANTIKLNQMLSLIPCEGPRRSGVCSKTAVIRWKSIPVLVRQH